MGHFIFSVLHLIAIFGGFYLLLITIPAHLIYSAVNANRPKAPPPQAPVPHIKCPDCAELVKLEAKICKHCGKKLTPQ